MTLQKGKIKCLNRGIIIFASVVMLSVLNILSSKLLFFVFSCHLYKWQKGDWVFDYWFVCLYFWGFFLFFYFSASVVSYNSQSFPDCCSSRFKNSYISRTKLKQATINNKNHVTLRFMSIYKQDYKIINPSMVRGEQWAKRTAADLCEDGRGKGSRHRC